MDAVEDEVPGVFARAPGRDVGVVQLLFVQRHAAGDAVVFQAHAAPNAVGVQVRSDVFVGGVPADVAIELAVGGIAGLPALGAPAWASGPRIAGEGGGARRRAYGGVHAVARAGPAELD